MTSDKVFSRHAVVYAHPRGGWAADVEWRDEHGRWPNSGRHFHARTLPELRAKVGEAHWRYPAVAETGRQHKLVHYREWQSFGQRVAEKIRAFRASKQ